MKRILEPEILDELSPTDPRAIRSRRDLQRINWWMRNPAHIARALQKHFWLEGPETVADLGAGDGDFSHKVAGKCARWKNVELVLVDRLKAASLTQFEGTTWKAQSVAADVFDWLDRGEKVDAVYTNLFLHHFSDEQLERMFEKISRTTDYFVACEPRRYRFASLIRFCVWVIGCSEVTLNDSVISVRAGFRNQELSQLWPKSSGWQLIERRAGLFSHVFEARKI